MKKKLSLIYLVLLSICSCKQSREDMLIGKWQAVELSNPQEEVMQNQQSFIDSFGKNNTVAQNIEMYGTDNVDSLRAFYQSQLDSFKQMFQYGLNNTRFEFKKNKVAVLNFGGQLDSANWYFDKKGNLILDDEKLKAVGDKTTMEVLLLTQDSLKLKFADDGMAGVASFIHIAE